MTSPRAYTDRYPNCRPSTREWLRLRDAKIQQLQAEMRASKPGWADLFKLLASGITAIRGRI